MGLIIDSTVLVTLDRGRQDLSALESRLPEGPIGVAAITVSELLAGVYRAESAVRRLGREALIEAVVERIPTFAFDLRVARTHARLWAQLASAGQLIGAHDLIIAATAITHDYSVLTDNIRDFDRVPGLDVRRPEW